MRYGSAISAIVDPYYAGVAVGESLAALAPEVILLFITIHHLDRMGEMMEGIRDVLGSGVRICGGTGDGIYEASGVAQHGVSALGIHGEGRVRWGMALERNVQADSALAGATAGTRAVAALDGASPCLGFVMADGTTADGSSLVAGLRTTLTAPFFGGLTADDRRFQRAGVFADDEVAEDAVVVLVASGELPFRICAASGWTPVGAAGRVTRLSGTTLHEIDGRRATDFVASEIGRAMSGTDLGVVPIAQYLDGDDGLFTLRCTVATDPVNGSITLFGRIHEGSYVRVCKATQTDILNGVDAALTGMGNGSFVPGAAVIMSCAGRKWLLAEAGAEEITRVHEMLGPIPLAGIPTFGEIAQVRRGDLISPPLFHNVTFVAGILGS